MAVQEKKKFSTKKWISITILLIVAVLVVYTLFFNPKSARYKEETVKTQDIYTYYSFSGNINAKNDTIAYSTTNDKVKKIYVQAGDHVEEDQLILTTESGEKYKSTIGGVVTSISVDEKDIFISGSQLYHVSDFSAPQVVIKVDEYDVDALSVGMPVNVFIHPLNKTVEGTVREISLEAIVTDNISFYEAYVDVVQDGTLRMGMSCEATLLKDSAENTVVLPLESVQRNEYYEPFVYAYGSEKKEVVQKPISLGINDGTYVEVLSGLSSGETILLPQKDLLYMMPMMERRGGS